MSTVPRLTIRCLGWYTDATKTTRVHEPKILYHGDPGAGISDAICPPCRDAFLERADAARAERSRT